MSKFLSVAGYALTMTAAAFILAAWVEPTPAAGVAVLCIVGLFVGLLEAAAIAIFAPQKPEIAGGVIMGAVSALIVLLASLQMGPPDLPRATFLVLVCAITGVVSGFIYRLAGLIVAPKKNQFIGG